MWALAGRQCVNVGDQFTKGEGAGEEGEQEVGLGEEGVLGRGGRGGRGMWVVCVCVVADTEGWEARNEVFYGLCVCVCVCVCVCARTCAFVCVHIVGMWAQFGLPTWWYHVRLLLITRIMQNCRVPCPTANSR